LSLDCINEHDQIERIAMVTDNSVPRLLLVSRGLRGWDWGSALLIEAGGSRRCA